MVLLLGVVLRCVCVVYDIMGSTADRNCVVLNNIHIDIMDYIQPATCTEAEFHKMWVEFEWENKITVNTHIKGLADFLDHVLTTTNMKCLTPKQVSQRVPNHSRMCCMTPCLGSNW